MQPQLVIDNSYGQPPVISFLQQITAPTLIAGIPHDMIALLAVLDGTPARTPSTPTPTQGPQGVPTLGKAA